MAQHSTTKKLLDFQTNKKLRNFTFDPVHGVYFSLTVGNWAGDLSYNTNNSLWVKGFEQFSGVYFIMWTHLPFFPMLPFVKIRRFIQLL